MRMKEAHGSEDKSQCLMNSCCSRYYSAIFEASSDRDSRSSNTLSELPCLSQTLLQLFLFRLTVQPCQVPGRRQVLSCLRLLQRTCEQVLFLRSCNCCHFLKAKRLLYCPQRRQAALLQSWQWALMLPRLEKT